VLYHPGGCLRGEACGPADRRLFIVVEIADLGGGAVALRDSTDYTRAPLRFTAAEWAAFTAGVRDGQF
jgi:hypothetical protein